MVALQRETSDLKVLLTSLGVEQVNNLALMTSLEEQLTLLSNDQNELSQLFVKSQKTNSAYFYELKGKMITKNDIEGLKPQYMQLDENPGITVIGTERNRNFPYPDWNPDVTKENSLAILSENPYDLASLKTLGRLAYEEGDRYGARIYYEKVIQLEPDYTPAYKFLERISYFDGDYESSAAYCRRLWDLEPTPQTAVSLAKNLFLMNDSALALEEVNRALKVNGSYIPALVLGGDICISLNNRERAIDFYTRALEIEESFPLYETLGDIFYKRGNQLQALEQWEKAMNLMVPNTQRDQDIALSLLVKMTKVAFSVVDKGKMEKYTYDADQLGGSVEIGILWIRFFKEKGDSPNALKRIQSFEKKYPQSPYDSELKRIKEWARGQ